MWGLCSQMACKRIWRPLLACQALHRDADLLVAQEICFIKENKIDLVVGDIPPLGFEIVARAGLPSVAVTNFTCDVTSGL
jgi:hypothetical protein